jgi:hypothetical protein
VVMARDFWFQALDSQEVTLLRSFTAVHLNPPDSPPILETASLCAADPGRPRQSGRPDLLSIGSVPQQRPCQRAERRSHKTGRTA